LYESVERPLELQVHLEQWRDFLKHISKVWLVLKSLINRIFQLSRCIRQIARGCAHEGLQRIRMIQGLVYHFDARRP
jgi:hypothetical protein